jgi:hypothetical protein
VTALLVDDRPRGLIAPFGRRANDPMTQRLGLDDLRTVGLDTLVDHAALMERTDRKYIVRVDTARALVDAIADTHRVLKIEGRRSTTYKSLYFDTPDLSSVQAHIQRRRRRWKVRSRLYVEDDLCRVDVKTKDNTGATIKVMAESVPSRFGTLVGAERRLVERQLAGYVDADVSTLVPAAEIDYTRSTLTDLDAGARVTIDWDLATRTNMGAAWLDSGYVLVETKGPDATSRANQVLSEFRIRPQRFSKYVAAASTTTPRIPDNDFRRLLARGVLHARSGPLAPQLMGVPSNR